MLLIVLFSVVAVHAFAQGSSFGQPTLSLPMMKGDDTRPPSERVRLGRTACRDFCSSEASRISEREASKCPDAQGSRGRRIRCRAPDLSRTLEQRSHDRSEMR